MERRRPQPRLRRHRPRLRCHRSKLATYVVQAGDSPSAIAERFTHDGKRWPELVAANPGKPVAHDGSFQAMRQGETLTLPSTWGSSPATHTQPNVHSTEAHP